MNKDNVVPMDNEKLQHELAYYKREYDKQLLSNIQYENKIDILKEELKIERAKAKILRIKNNTPSTTEEIYDHAWWTKEE